MNRLLQISRWLAQEGRLLGTNSELCSSDRLDFTVIGRDLNLTSRIERLCRELGRSLIMSGEFVAHLGQPMFEIGHFSLRGFTQMQLLFGPPEP